METQEAKLTLNHQAVVNRFVAACQADSRILAAFLGGSYARGAADEYSDLDLYIITTDEDFNDFYAQRDAFLHLLGEPLFSEDFEVPDVVFFILADGTEGELGFGRESRFDHIHSGPYKVLLDKKSILDGAVFPGQEPDSAEQLEELRRLIYWFWHDLSHFITAIGRGQHWWAQGQLEELRRYCVNLARLRINFLDTDTGEEPYFKLDKAIPVEMLSDLQVTYCSMDKNEMVKASRILLRFYKEMAVPLARTHAIPYPDALERLLVQRLENISNKP